MLVFIMLHYVSLLLFMKMLRHVRRSWRGPKTLGRRSIKRLQRERPQVLIRMRALERQVQKIVEKIHEVSHRCIFICLSGGVAVFSYIQKLERGPGLEDLDLE